MNPPESDEHFKRNFLLGVLNGMLVNFGLAFIDPFTVVPVFIAHAGGSSVLVGLAAAVYGAGWFLPQVFVARYAATRWRVLNIYRFVSILRVLMWACVVTVVFTIDPVRTQLFVWMVVTFMFAGTVCAGVAAIPFLEVTSKTIPPERRGSFFGVRRLSGGALGIFAGVVVAVVVGGETKTALSQGGIYRAVETLLDAIHWTGQPFPYDYGILIATGAVLSAAGLFVFGLIHEPDSVATNRLQPLGVHLREGFDLLRHRRNYRLFFLVRVCWQFTSMAFPFYAAYAYTELGFSEASVGLFVSIWVGSGVVSNYVWGRLADRSGNKIVLVLTAVIALAPPLAVLMAAHEGAVARGGGPEGWVFWLLASTFFINGSSRSGRFISNMTYLLEFAPERQRPLYVGFMNSLSFPFMLSPALGGWVVHVFSYQALFGLSALFSAVSVALSAGLIEPRARRPAEASEYMP